MVFLRPGVAGHFFAVVVDAKSRYYGHFGPRQYAVAEVPPGRHTFSSWSYSVNGEMWAPNLIHANLEPGRIYYVLLRGWTGYPLRGVDLEALSPQRDEWTNLDNWLSASKQLDVDSEAGTRSLPAKLIRRASAGAKEAYADYRAAKQQLHNIGPSDGQLTAPTLPPN